jgi:predicted AAA+ superfamily ATPase
VIRYHSGAEGECYFWSTHGRAELDLLIVAEGRRIGYEVKYTESPRATRSMQTARTDLRLDELHLVYPGERCFPVAEGIDAVGLGALAARRMDEAKRNPSFGA